MNILTRANLTCYFSNRAFIATKTVLGAHKHGADGRDQHNDVSEENAGRYGNGDGVVANALEQVLEHLQVGLPQQRHFLAPLIDDDYQYHYPKGSSPNLVDPPLEEQIAPTEVDN